MRYAGPGEPARQDVMRRVMARLDPVRISIVGVRWPKDGIEIVRVFDVRPHLTGLAGHAPPAG